MIFVVWFRLQYKGSRVHQHSCWSPRGAIGPIVLRPLAEQGAKFNHHACLNNVLNVLDGPNSETVS